MTDILKGTTSFLDLIFIQDSSSTTGAGLTGLTSGSSGLVCYRARSDDGNAAGTQITLSAGTRGTWSSGGFVEKDATNMPGWYEFGVPNAALATGSRYCGIGFKGATNMAPLSIKYNLVNYDSQDGAGFGLSRIDAAVTSRMATYTQPTGFLAATFPSGTVANQTNITGGTITTVGTLTTYTGNTPQTGDAFARLGAPAGASVSADVAAIKSDTGTVLTDVNAGAGAIYTRLGAPTGASIAADVAAVKTDTAAVKTQTDKLAFTVANQVDANVLSLNSDAGSAANIAKTTKVIGRGTASGVPTTTSIPTSACAPAGAAADQFKGRIITFDANTTTTALRGQATDITASSNAATPTFTVTALTTAPTAGDTFSVT